jgi:hypothetical protein
VYTKVYTVRRQSQTSETNARALHVRFHPDALRAKRETTFPPMNATERRYHLEKYQCAPRAAGRAVATSDGGEAVTLALRRIAADTHDAALATNAWVSRVCFSEVSFPPRMTRRISIGRSFRQHSGVSSRALTRPAPLLFIPAA